VRTQRKDPRDALPASARLESIRARRLPRERATPIGDAIERLTRSMRTHESALAPARLAWAEIMPKIIAERSSLVSLRAGTLTIRITESPTRFAADRLLRAGAEIRFLKRCPRSIRRLRLVP
jgi:hypothetical protein